jgi:hypothetical protein
MGGGRGGGDAAGPAPKAASSALTNLSSAPWKFWLGEHRD